jgi:MoaA/NifB/PqqE/SkfB family radical SAM enzyme
MNDQPIEERKFLPFPQIKKELKEFKKKGYNIVGFLGGELTVYPRIIELVKFATKLDYKRINLVSNGRRYSDINFLKHLIAAGNIRFYLSVHSHKEKIEDFLTSVKGGFKEKIKGLYNLVSLQKRGLIKEKIFINLVANKLNYKFFSQTMFFYFKNFGIKDFRFNFIRPEGRAFNNFKILVPTYSEVLPYLKESVLLSKKLNVNLSAEGIPFCILKGIKNFNNFIGEFKDGEGEIKEGEDNRKQFKFAKLRKEKLRSKMKSCKNCIYDSLCEGPWKNYVKIYGFKEFKPIKSA